MSDSTDDDDLEVATVPASHLVESLLGTIAWLRGDPRRRRVVPRVYGAEPMDLDAFLTWFHRRLDLKIDRDEPRRGRKDDPDWERAARQLAARVNRPRLVVREAEVPLEFRGRLRHRIHVED